MNIFPESQTLLYIKFFFFQGDHTLSRKKVVWRSPHSWAGRILSVLTRRPEIVQKPPHNRAGCIVEPFNASRQLKFQFCQKLVKVVTFMCARGPAPHVARGRKHCKRMASLYKHMGKLQRAVTLILRCESKFLKVKSLHSIHSARRCKNCPQVLPVPPWIN